MAAIPLQLVTGFLGSGKTTFLKNYLRNFAAEKRIGIIQNEFAPVNVDANELRGEQGQYEILEVNNGSVFCVCLLGSFIDSLARFIGEVQPEELLLEASGMSDPVSIGQILQAEKLRGKVYLDYIWCLADAVNFERISKLQTRVNHQVRMADTIILNKIDLAAENPEAIKAELRKLNPFATIEAVRFAQVSFQKKKQPFRVFPEVQDSLPRPDLESLVIKTNLFISEENLHAFLAEIREQFVRCKGHVSLKGKQKAFVQGVYSQYEVKKTAFFEAPTELVAIGNFTDAASFQKLFENYCTHDS
ncbi:MAG: hypothetical protein A2W90_01920 [Bacteroidetes bacterium GWF2_42_66]|nr:MAG: hypothetical protein A2W92_06675 [Bacteroidetes bacterium GWA2_42_15]OFY01113.1 MAG: hypothetical protein A2W89_15405 [Bacteroidetes bacterium GWE2_42_39]OFY41956.1 MAG: hypothetical protein A2W90_01920 [Bacteroidetes bacterium GWF2_42_66]HBL77849.1 hypothetical protein [Prolixibacteraceae bacterium]HCU63330.1 hypothetical protein [Prolixibacteraceae bacterium]